MPNFELQEERAREQNLAADVAKLEAYLRGDPGHSGARERLDNVSRGLQKSRNRIAELTNQTDGERMDFMRDLASRGGHREAGTDFGPTPERQNVDAGIRRSAAFTEAQQVLERHINEGVMRGADADRLDGVLRGDDRHHGLDAQYIAATGQDAYRSAFLKVLQYGDGAMLRMTAEEQNSLQQVIAAERLRTMSTGVGSAGGFGLPIALDPTMILDSPGTISPIRQLASKVTISGREYRAITTGGVVATFEPELTEATDNSPTLNQPDIFTEKAQAFVPLSIEVGADYPDLLGELAGLFGEAKTILEAQMFLTGQGHQAAQPMGLITGLAGTDSVVTTAASDTWAVSDLYATQDSLSPRWQPNAQWLMSLGMFNTTKRLVASASTVEPQIVSPDGRLLLNKPWSEVSDMAQQVVGGADITVYGDIAKTFRIVDRIGMSVELIQHLFGPNRMPMGERGIYAYWRTSSAVIVPDAARLVQVAS